LYRNKPDVIVYVCYIIFNHNFKSTA